MGFEGLEQAPGLVCIDECADGLLGDFALVVDEFVLAEVAPNVFDFAAHVGRGEAVNGIAADIAFAFARHKQRGAHDSRVGAAGVERQQGDGVTIVQ